MCQNHQNTAFSSLYYLVRKKATEMVYIWGDGDRGYPSLCFEYETVSEGYLVVEI